MDLSLNDLLRMWQDDVVPHLPEVGHMWFVAALGLLLLCLIVIYRGPSTRILRERTMSSRTKERKVALEASRVADAVTSGFEDALYKGHITRAEARKWYTRISHNCSLPDLLPRRLSSYIPDAAEIKGIIKARLGNGINKPVNIPGPKPAEKVKREKTLSDMLRVKS